MTSRSRWSPLQGIHSLLEVIPTITGDLLVGFGNSARGLPNDVQQHEEVLRASVQDSVELAPIMATKLTQLTFDLRGMGKREWRIVRFEHVKALDLVIEGSLTPWVQPVDEICDRLRTIRRAVIDSLHRSRRSAQLWLALVGTSSFPIAAASLFLRSRKMWP